ncbi:MAG TPA: hypothetical protein DGT21_24450 [Armatimonadetes bacterium]|jgi:MoaA/NifB/PqqE/SkfB family radical SAM enzyme|nr:hypothetical protein [Armatimonadota bacterium]
MRQLAGAAICGSGALVADGQAVTRPVSAIVSLTLDCPHACSICAVNARCTRGLAAAAAEDTARADALIAAIHDLRRLGDVSLDFSGGDPLSFPCWREVVTASSQVVGRDAVSVSTTGTLLDDAALEVLERTAGEVYLTVETVRDGRVSCRSRRSVPDAWAALDRMRQSHLVRGVALVLRASLNLSRDHLVRLYDALAEVGVSALLVLRFMPVGRASVLPHEMLSRHGTLVALDILRDLERAEGPRIRLHRLLHPLLGEPMICCGARDIYLSANGIVTDCPWAIDPSGAALPEFVLGSIHGNTIADVYLSRRAAQRRALAAVPTADCRLIQRAAHGRRPG